MCIYGVALHILRHRREQTVLWLVLCSAQIVWPAMKPHRELTLTSIPIIDISSFHPSWDTARLARYSYADMPRYGDLGCCLTMECTCHTWKHRTHCHVTSSAAAETWNDDSGLYSPLQPPAVGPFCTTCGLNIYIYIHAYINWYWFFQIHHDFYMTSEYNSADLRWQWAQQWATYTM